MTRTEMTHTQYQTALQVIKAFLIAHGFDENKRTKHGEKDVQDGHWMLWWIEINHTSTCPNCFQPYVENLLRRLENGSYLFGQPVINGVDHAWHPEFSDQIRRAAGLADPS